MTRTNALSLLACLGLVSCAQVGPYRPVSTPESTEYAKTMPAVYPDDIRANPAKYANSPVVWVGIIRSTDAQEEDTTSKIRLDTVFEHHYFDWRQKGAGANPRLKVSSRGEGSFRCRWHMSRTARYIDTDLDVRDAAEKYAAPGKLAIIYGIPQSVDSDGTVVLKYHYIRILPSRDYSTDGVDYGRLGEVGTPERRAVSELLPGNASLTSQKEVVAAAPQPVSTPQPVGTPQPVSTPQPDRSNPASQKDVGTADPQPIAELLKAERAASR